MEVLINCAEWISPADIQVKTTVKIEDNMSMAEVEVACSNLLKTEKDVNLKEGLLTYHKKYSILIRS